jgi:hypothetical protein
VRVEDLLVLLAGRHFDERRQGDDRLEETYQTHHLAAISA